MTDVDHELGAIRFIVVSSMTKRYFLGKYNVSNSIMNMDDLLIFA